LCVTSRYDVRFNVQKDDNREVRIAAREDHANVVLIAFDFADRAWEDYLYWVRSDKRILRRINDLIGSVRRDPFDRIGKTEPLRHQLQRYRSRRISDEHRLVYTVSDDTVVIIQCRFHC